MVSTRGAKGIRHRIEVGKILSKTQESLSAKQISDKLHDSQGSRRKLVRVRLTANSISQMLRGAKGIRAKKESRYENSSCPTKVFQMENHDEYTFWVESKRKINRRG